MSDSRDSYSHTRYRHLIAWPARLQREGPLLERVLSAGPVRRVLDLGSGPGDHARFLARIGLSPAEAARVREHSRAALTSAGVQADASVSAAKPKRKL